MSDESDFKKRNEEFIDRMGADQSFIETTREWFKKASRHEYSYHFEWLGRPVIQFPQDMMALQEVIFAVKPDLVIETGVARGGSLIYTASLLELLGGDRKVLGIELELRDHNRQAILEHPMSRRINLIDGSSIAEEVVGKVKRIASNYDRILVCLDSDHTHSHVLGELEAYSSLVSVGSYLVVFDTIIEFMPPEFSIGKRWSPGNNAMTAVRAFLEDHPEFQIDERIHNKLSVTVAPYGWLKRIS